MINCHDSAAIKDAAGTFDLILSTVNAPLDWNSYLPAFKPRGRVHMPGAVIEPIDLNLIPMMFNQLSLSFSPVGSPPPSETCSSLPLGARSLPSPNNFPMSQVNEAISHLESGNARYRIVIDRE